MVDFAALNIPVDTRQLKELLTTLEHIPGAAKRVEEAAARAVQIQARREQGDARAAIAAQRLAAESDRAAVAAARRAAAEARATAEIAKATQAQERAAAAAKTTAAATEQQVQAEAKVETAVRRRANQYTQMAVAEAKAATETAKATAATNAAAQANDKLTTAIQRRVAAEGSASRPAGLPAPFAPAKAADEIARRRAVQAAADEQRKVAADAAKAAQEASKLEVALARQQQRAIATATANARLSSTWTGTGIAAQRLEQATIRTATAKLRLSQAQERATATAGVLGNGYARLFATMGNGVGVSVALQRSLAGIGIGLGAAGVIQAADEWTRLTNRLRTATTDSGNLAAVQDELYRVATSSRSGLADTVELYARMSAASKDLGLSQRQAIDLTETLQKALKLGGATTTEAAAATLQLSQALGSGRLNGDELRSILENSRPVAEAIAKEFGVTVGELKKLGSEGKLTSDKVASAILKMKGDVDKSFAVLPVTVSEGLTLVQNSFLKYIGAADQASGRSRMLADGLQWIAKNAKDVFPAVQTLVGVLGGLALGSKAGPIGAILGAAAGGGLAALDAYRDKVIQINGATATVGAVAKTVWGDIRKLIDGAVASAEKYIESQSKSGGGSGGGADRPSWLTKVDRFLATTEQEIDGIVAAFDRLSQVDLSNLFKGAADSDYAKTFLQPLLQAEDFVSNRLPRIVAGFQATRDTISSVWGDFSQWFGGIMGSAVTTGADKLSELSSKVSAALSPVTELFKKMAADIGTALDPLVSTVSDLFDRAMTSAMGVISKAGAVIIGMVKGLATLVSSGLGAAAGGAIGAGIGGAPGDDSGGLIKTWMERYGGARLRQMIPSGPVYGEVPPPFQGFESRTFQYVQGLAGRSQADRSVLLSPQYYDPPGAVSTVTGTNKTNAAAAAGAKELASQADKARKALAGLKLEADFGEKIAAAAKIGSAAVEQVEIEGAASKKALELLGGKADTTGRAFIELRDKIAASMKVAKDADFAKSFNLATKEIEQQNAILQKQLELQGQSPEIIAREIALLKVRQEVVGREGALGQEAMQRRIDAVTQQELLNQKLEKSKELGGQFAKITENAISGMQDAFTSFFEKLYSGSVASWKDLAGSLKSIWARLMAEMTTMSVITPIVQFINGGVQGGGGGLLGGALGGGGQQASSSGSSGGSLLNNLLGGGGTGSGGGLFGGINSFLSRPLSGGANPIFGSPFGGGLFSGAELSGGGVPGGVFGGGTTVGGALSGIAGIGMGAMGLLRGGNSTVSTIGNGLMMAGGLVSMIPGFGQIAGPIMMAIGGIMSMFKKKMKTPQAVANVSFGPGGDITSSIAASGTRTRNANRQGVLGAGDAFGTSYRALLDTYGLSTSDDFMGGWILNSQGKKTGDQWIVGLGSYGSYTPLPGVDPTGKARDAASSISGLKSGEDAVNTLAGLITRRGAETGTLLGLTQTQRTALTNSDLKSIDEIKAALDFSRVFDDLVRGPDSLTAMETSVRDLNDKFRAAIASARAYGLDIDIVEKRRQESIDRLATDMNDDYRRRLIGQTDTGELQLGIEDIGKERKAALDNATYLAGVSRVTPDLSQINRFYQGEYNRLGTDFNDDIRRQRLGLTAGGQLQLSLEDLDQEKAVKLQQAALINSVSEVLASINEIEATYAARRKQTIEQALGTAYDDFIRGAENITASEQAMRQLNAQIETLSGLAAAAGKDVGALNARAEQERRQIGVNFNEGVRRSLLGLNDPAALQREDLAKAQEARQKEAEYLNALFPGLINFADLIKLNERELAELEKTLAHANDNIRNALDRLRYGTEQSPYTVSQRYGMALREYQSLEAMAIRKDPMLDKDRLTGVADTLLQYAKQRFSVTEDYAKIADRVERLYRFLLGEIPEFADGGTAGPGLISVGERGREFLYLSRPATVVSSGDSDAIAANGVAQAQQGATQVALLGELVKAVGRLERRLESLERQNANDQAHRRARGA